MLQKKKKKNVQRKQIQKFLFYKQIKVINKLKLKLIHYVYLLVGLIQPLSREGTVVV